MTSTKPLAALALATALAACGGSNGTRSDMNAAPAFASGPIQIACLRSDRRSASRQLCGCVQAAANISLSGNDQSRAVEFFRTPHLAQEIRQSDRARDEAFWQRYRTFVEVAERRCA
ncbi:MAG: hypothetical protein AAGF30_03770 [Pseudomonadota bacterium]